MTASLLNTEITAEQWAKLGTRERLRQIAARHGISRGRDKQDTAAFLACGMPYPFQSLHAALNASAKIVRFAVRLEIP